jgi:hypothetical protein
MYVHVVVLRWRSSLGFLEGDQDVVKRFLRKKYFLALLLFFQRKTMQSI